MIKIMEALGDEGLDEEDQSALRAFGGQLSDSEEDDDDQDDQSMEEDPDMETAAKADGVEALRAEPAKQTIRERVCCNVIMPKSFFSSTQSNLARSQKNYIINQV